MEEPTTFKELYEFLQKDLDFFQWLSNNWQGKEKQESVLRLFSSLGLINKLNNFDVCKGNFNKQTITKIKHFKEIFYNDSKEIMLNDKGDSSDLTAINKYNLNNILATTSKNLKKYNIGNLDIDKILINFQKYKEKFNLTLCICIPDIKQYIKMKKGIEKTNKYLQDVINRIDTIIIDQKDLYRAYKLFKIKYEKIQVIDLLENNKKPIIFKFHQKLSMYKAIILKEKKVKEILFGHIPRSGKSYIIAGCIIVNNKLKKDKNYLFITTAPNETLSQQFDIFNNSIELNSFNIMIIDGKNKNKPKNIKNNIILCSKQFLQNKKIKWLFDMRFDMRFIDESHNGATTEISKQILSYYGKNSFTVQITATYSKPTNTFNIKKENQILWDTEDINLCQKIDENNLKKLILKHGYLIDKIIKNYTFEDIQKEYSKYPKLWVITLDLNEDFIDKINQKTIDNDYGWSTEACFLLNNEKKEFQNIEKNLNLWYQIFGKFDEYGILDNKYKNNSMEKIKNICKNHHSRFFDNPGETPLAIMAFLPQNNINEISQASKKLLEENKVIPDFDIVIINSKTTNDAKILVIEAKEKAKVNRKKGVLVLSGRQCSMGVSLNFCDIVLLLNNNKSYDMLFQMMNRGMTEAKNKTCGFVVDLNIHRLVQNVIIEYAFNIKPYLHPIEGLKYILNERLININNDAVMKISEGLSKKIYDIYKSNINCALDHSLNKLKFKFIKLDKDDEIFLVSIFGNSNSKSKKIKEEKQIQKGIEKEEIKKEKESEENKVKKKEEIKEEFNFMDKLRHIIPITCLLTIQDSETEFHLMLDIIKNNHYLSKIFIEQIIIWWQKEIDIKSIENFIQMYKKYLMEDKETKQIIRTVKELFKESINDRNRLSMLVDKYFIPTEIEKKSNAEVSTPSVLRNEMLDKIPLEFWKEKKKVFEPCSGKGGFLIDIINRFMIGLKDKIKDEKERYKVIVEECLYFSDINETNIFICKLLINPNNEYKLNYNLGNTLELDIDGFDAVIGNPPYNDNSGNKGKGHTLWTKFIEVSLQKWINKGGYLLYVNPSLWRQADHPLQIIMKQYQIEYLEIHDESDGFKIFNCNTRYDWYLIKKVPYFKNTKIKTQKGEFFSKDLSKLNFIPNYNYDLIDKLTNSNDKVDMLYSRSDYASDKKWTKKIKDNEFKYPVVYSVNRKHEAKFLWSNINTKEGHYNKSKVIFGSGATGFIIDEKGEYACCEFCTGIIDKIENLEKIKNVLNSLKFKNEVIKATSVSKAEINRKILKYFNKDFWKEFI